jgi:hypothetical protein
MIIYYKFSLIIFIKKYIKYDLKYYLDVLKYYYYNDAIIICSSGYQSLSHGYKRLSKAS